MAKSPRRSGIELYRNIFWLLAHYYPTHKMPKQRLVYIDLAKLVAIYLVVLGHVIVRSFADEPYGDALYVSIYTFHMPLFMMMSGFFASSVLKLDFCGLLRKRLVQLLLPAVSCTVICLAYFFFTSDTVDCRTEIIGNSWFLKTLFLCNVTFWLVKRVKLPDVALFLGSWLIILLIPHSYSLQYNWMYPFFWMGYFLRKHDWVLEKYCGKIAVCSILLFAVCLTLKFAGHYNIDLLPTLDMPVSQLILLLFKFILGGVGSVMVIALCRLICSRPRPFLERLAYFGRYTLGIYVTQSFLVVNVFHDIMPITCANTLLRDLVAILLSVVFTIMCVLVIRVLARVKLLDIVLYGGQYRSC